jgi:outer membrane protein assembly factor BamD (BamD/ComL family)
MKRRLPAPSHGLLPVLGLLLGLSAPCLCVAQTKSLGSDLDPKVQAEIEYASRLIDLGLPEFSDMVLKKVNDPSARNMLEVLRMRGLLMRGKFDEAKALIAGKTGEAAEATRLALADGFFMWGKYPQAQEIYADFFSKYPNGPSESMNKFYMDAAYKYGQMLLYMKKDKEAIDAYKFVLKAKLQRHEMRQMQGEMAEIMLKMAEEDTSPNGAVRAAMLPQVEKIAGDLLWIQDLWWGKAVVFLAHIKMIKGDTAGALKLIDDYRSQLMDMDRQLKEESEKEGVDFTKLSPMAQVRFMVAAMQLREAEKLLAEAVPDREKIGTLLVGPRAAGGARDPDKGALSNFYDIFVNYPRTPWAPQAGRSAKRVKKILEDLGAKLNIAISDEKWNEVAKVQFLEARSLFSQGQYTAALENYYSIINIFPESEMSVDALGEMVRCYIELANEETPVYAPMLAGYMAERFCCNSNLAMKAGDQLMRVAELFGEKGNQAAKDALYKQFFTLYPGHAQAPGVQFRLGEQELRKENYAAALEHFKDIAARYEHLPLSMDSQNRIAFCYGKLEDVTNEVAALKAFIAGLEKHNRAGHVMMLDARNRLAYATWKQGPENYVAALKQFQEIITLLSPETHPWSGSDEDKQRSQEILESAMFFKAVGFGSIREPAEKAKDFRAAAIRSFGDLVKRFPKSKYAARSLSQQAALYFADGEAAKATDVIRQLEKDYADSSEAKNSTYTMAVSLLAMGFREQALKYFREMFTGKGKFTDSQIYSASSELMKAREFETALGGFDAVAANSVTNRQLHEPALLGKGKCLVELGRYQDAVTSLSSFTNTYSRSGSLIDAALFLARAYSQLATAESDRQKRVAIFNMGVTALKEARRFEKSKGGLARLTYEQGLMQEMKATSEEKFGTKERALEFSGEALAAYQALILTHDAADPSVGEWMRKADMQCIPLLMKVGNDRDAFENCEMHIKRFPSSPHLPQIRRWRNQLRASLVSKGESIPAAAEPEPAAETNVPVAATATNLAATAATPAAETNAPAPAK